MDTPRTDERLGDVRVECCDSSCYVELTHNGVACEVVSADFARSLEREIAELQQKIADMELQNELARLGF